jgi:hypothetical protein
MVEGLAEPVPIIELLPQVNASSGPWARIRLQRTLPHITVIWQKKFTISNSRNARRSPTWYVTS